MDLVWSGLISTAVGQCLNAVECRKLAWSALVEFSSDLLMVKTGWYLVAQIRGCNSMTVLRIGVDETRDVCAVARNACGYNVYELSYICATVQV